MPPTKREVGTLGEALLCINDYANPDKILSFVVAPLATLRGGQRSWQGLKDVKGQTVWAPEKEEGVFAPELPTPDKPNLTYPPLPDSPINRWAFAFVDTDSRILKPEIEINPALVATGQGAPAGHGAQVNPPPPPPPPPPPQPSYTSAPRPTGGGGDVNAELVALIRGQAEDQRSLLAETRAVIIEGRVTMSAVAREYQTIAEERRAQAQAAAAEAARIKAERDQALAANSQLSITVAEQRAQSQVGETVRAIYGGHPEQFTGALRDVFSGLVHALKQS